MPSRYLLSLLLLLAPIACGGAQGSAGSTVTQAAVGTGLAVAAAGLNRAVNHECWAACRPGLVCDPASGLCVEQGMARKPAPSRSSGLEPVAANPPGREYEVPALGSCDGDAGLCGDAGGDAAAR
jgi:hypothetical protein